MKKLHAALAAALALFAGNVVAAQTGELWEVSSVMDIPGMPAGMGAQKSQVCRAKNEPPAGRSDCTVSNVKRSGLTETMTVSCPGQGEMTMEMTYNAAHTEYTGVMHAQSGRREMVIKTSGKKLGACDPALAKTDRDQKAQAAVARSQRQQAEIKASLEETNKKTIAECAAAVDNMRPAVLLKNKEDEAMYRKTNNWDQVTDPKRNPGASAILKCREYRPAFCKEFQTRPGFLKTRRDERSEAGQLCDVSPTKLHASFCSTAVKSEDFAFAGTECLPESASLGEKYCGGLDYTAVITDKRTGKFCYRYLSYKAGKVNEEATQDYMERNEQEAKTPSTRKVSGSAPSASTSAPTPAAAPTDAATEAVNQGISKLKGLFGR